MRKFILISVLAAISLGAGSKELPFRDGEKFTLSLMYKWGAVNSEVGTATIMLDSLDYGGKPAYYSQITARSAPFFEMFYKIREHFHSWFTADDLLPQKYIRETLQGDYSAYNLFHYDWDNKLIHAQVRHNEGDTRNIEMPLTREVCDLPLMIYRIRALNLSNMDVGQKIPVSFTIDEDVYDIVVTYLGDQRLRVRKMGWYTAHHLSCTVVNGALFDGKTQIEFWLSADEKKTPLAMMAPLKIGRIWAWLSSADYGKKRKS